MAVGEIGYNALGICESATTAGCIVVSDCSNNRIQEYSLDGSKPPRARVVVQFKDRSNPIGIAPCGDGTGDYIVVLQGLHQVTRISGVDGSAMWTVGSEGSGVDNFHFPLYVVVLPNGQVVVSDHANDRLQVLDIKTGKFVKHLG